MPHISIGWTKEPPAGQLDRLNAALAEIAPNKEGRPWLYAYWEPGDAWGPLERIVVAEMYPRSMYEAEDRFYRALGYGSDVSKLAELDGPNPRYGAVWNAERGELVYPDGRLPPTITERQWLLWREHGALAKPFWIIEGTAGGHPRRYSRFERELARVERRPLAPPRPGSEDYAGFDGRVVPAIRAHEAARRLSDDVSDDWMLKDEPELTAPERILRATFDDWYSSRNEDRASGKIIDAAYDPSTGRMVARTY